MQVGKPIIEAAVSIAIITFLAAITACLCIVLIACALSLTSSVGTARQAIRVPAIQACH
ncbi:hypothetical protein [Amycolatopsis sp. NPDC004079]|uniref:hypothetical protein n=1 Tax=Amycolatopsis sp. NPDC004079 TaxID=3154549 RepID=UPI0033B136FB